VCTCHKILVHITKSLYISNKTEAPRSETTFILLSVGLTCLVMVW